MFTSSTSHLQAPATSPGCQEVSSLSSAAECQASRFVSLRRCSLCHSHPLLTVRVVFPQGEALCPTEKLSLGVLLTALGTSPTEMTHLSQRSSCAIGHTSQAGLLSPCPATSFPWRGQQRATHSPAPWENSASAAQPRLSPRWQPRTGLLGQERAEEDNKTHPRLPSFPTNQGVLHQQDTEQEETCSEEMHLARNKSLLPAGMERG